MRWALAQIEPPVSEPVSLEEAKLHLRVDGDDEDALITRAIAAARGYCEDVQGRIFVTRRLRLSLERWPCGRSIYLPRPPLRSVEVITYLTEDGTLHTLDPSLYIVDTASEPGAVHLVPGASWPAESLAPGAAVRIEYTAGYGGPNDVPDEAKQAILLLVGHWYENRETVVVGQTSQSVALAVEALLWQDRFWFTGPEG